jgi:hypothetical protein
MANSARIGRSDLGYWSIPEMKRLSRPLDDATATGWIIPSSTLIFPTLIAADMVANAIRGLWGKVMLWVRGSPVT